MLLVYLGLTILLELPIFLLFWRKQGWMQALLFCILLNGFTNPALNLILENTQANTWLMEVVVVLVEMVAAMLMFQAKWQKALAFSFCANAFSYGVGLVLFAIGWL